jgi:glutaredoxin
MIKIYTSENCPYCVKLKTGLDDLNIKYLDIDIADVDYTEEVISLFEIAEAEVIPIIIMGSTLLVPGRTFNTIDEAIAIIQNLLDN